MVAPHNSTKNCSVVSAFQILEAYLSEEFLPTSVIPNEDEIPSHKVSEDVW